MTSAVAVTLGVALLVWPDGRAAARLRTLVGARRDLARWRVPRPGAVAVIGGLTVAGLLAVGPGGALAVAIGAVTAWRRRQGRTDARRAVTAVAGLAQALRSVVADLRAGAHPAEAAESAASDAQPDAATALRALAGAARLDGDVNQALAASRAGAPALAGILDQVARAWTLAQRHGLPLADVLDAVRDDLDQRYRFERRVRARMAGPRASAVVLALLPALGLVLGQLLGARPLHVLTTSTGQLLLVTGTGLICAGLAWSARITGQVVAR